MCVGFYREKQVVKLFEVVVGLADAAFVFLANLDVEKVHVAKLFHISDDGVEGMCGGDVAPVRSGLRKQLIINRILHLFEQLHVVDVVHAEFVEAFFEIIVGVDAVGTEIFGVFGQIFWVDDILPGNHVHEDIGAVLFQYFLKFAKTFRQIVEIILHLEAVAGVFVHHAFVMVLHKLGLEEPVVFSDVDPAVESLVIASPYVLVVKSQSPFSEAEMLPVVCLEIALEGTVDIAFVRERRSLFLDGIAFQRLQTDGTCHGLQQQYHHNHYREDE